MGNLGQLGDWRYFLARGFWLREHLRRLVPDAYCHLLEYLVELGAGHSQVNGNLKLGFHTVTTLLLHESYLDQDLLTVDFENAFVVFMQVVADFALRWQGHCLLHLT